MHAASLSNRLGPQMNGQRMICDAPRDPAIGNKAPLLGVEARTRAGAILRLAFSVIMAIGWALIGDAVHQVRFAIRHVSHFEI